VRFGGLGQKFNLISDDVSERAAVRRLEGFNGYGVGFDDVASPVNGAVKRNEDTFALRFGRAGQTHGV